MNTRISKAKTPIRSANGTIVHGDASAKGQIVVVPIARIAHKIEAIGTTVRGHHATRGGIAIRDATVGRSARLGQSRLRNH